MTISVIMTLMTLAIRPKLIRSHNNLISCCLTGSQISDTFLHVSEDLNDQTFVWLLTLCRLLLDHTYADRSWTLYFEFCASGPSFSIDQTTPHFSFWLIIKYLLTFLLETGSTFTFFCLQKLVNPFFQKGKNWAEVPILCISSNRS